MNMRPNMKPLILIAGLGLALGGPLSTLADSPPAMPPGHTMDGAAHGHEMGGCMEHGAADGMHHGMEQFAEGGPLPPMLRHLQLSEAQQDKVFAILHAAAPQAREFRKAMEKTHHGLHELVTGASYDDAKAKTLTDALGKAMADEALLHARTHRQIFDVLTPEQRQMLARHGEHGPGGGHHDEHPEMAPR